MPIFTKFLKKVMSNKQKLKKFATMPLSKKCSIVIQYRLPIEKQDPRSFTVPCSFENIHVDKCLCDLGSNINLVVPKIVVLQLTDHSV